MMDSNRLARALSRIEAAATRIEAAAGANGAPDCLPDATLQGKYDQLRGEAGAALADLDALIDKLER